MLKETISRNVFQRKISVLVGMPSMGEWKAKYGTSVMEMETYFMSTPVPGFREQKIIPYGVRGSILPRSRLNIVRDAIKNHCSHVLFVDADQIFPKNTLHRLLKWDKDIVGCNIATKQIPARPTAKLKGENFWGIPCYTDPLSPDLEQVWRLGTGIMLVRTSVWEKLGLNTWEILWKDEVQDYQGEDWRFCELAEKAGYKIWVDHRLSEEVKHIGDYEYDHDVVGERQLVEVSQKAIGER